MTNVVNLKPSLADKILDVLEEAEDMVLIGVSEEDLKLVSTVSTGDVVLLLEAAKAEVVARYVDSFAEEE